MMRTLCGWNETTGQEASAGRGGRRAGNEKGAAAKESGSRRCEEAGNFYEIDTELLLTYIMYRRIFTCVPRRHGASRDGAV